MADKKSGFKLSFPENQKRRGNLNATRRLSYDDFGEFEDEREKIQRTIDQDLETELRIDYSDFVNHVCFDSALQKFDIAKKRVLNDYPFDGNAQEKYAHIVSGSGYDEYILNQWPRYVGYLNMDGTDQYISGTDVNNFLLLATSSLYVSAWIKPTISEQNAILQVMSASAGPIKRQGYEFYLSGATDPHLKFAIYSGSEVVAVSAAYADYTASFNNVAAMYDQPGDILYLYINNERQVSSSVGFDSIEFNPVVFTVGSASLFTATSSSYEFYSGSIDEVRVAHTASETWHFKNYNRPIDAEDYVRLHYRLNESITETGSIDEIAVDYSKSGLHGKYLNYDSSRSSGSVMFTDPGDPVLYSFHSDVISFTSSIEISASLFDNNNNNNIFNMIPQDLLIEDDDQEGLLTSFALSMARYFDEVKLYIDQLDNLRITNYDGHDEVPDQFLQFAMRYFGWQSTEHYSDIEPLPFYFGEGVLSSGSLDTTLLGIKNQFWRRMLNNFPYIIQSKGKRASVDAFLNVVGVGKENIKLKEFGYLKEGSIDNQRIYSETPVPMLGIGTGSFGVLSSSFVKATGSVTSALSTYTVETTMQLPYFSASYSGSLLTGSVWQFVDPEQVTGSFTLLWARDSLAATTGKFVLTSSDGQSHETSAETLFDGDIVYVAAGLNVDNKPFIDIRTIDNDEIDFSASYVGATVFSGVFTGSKYDFIMGANSGSTYTYETQGHYGEYRLWSRPLSGSEMDGHATHYASVGVLNPQETPHPLLGHWALDENKAANVNGIISNIVDYSRNGLTANGAEFPTDENPYEKFLLQYNYLSPSLDLKFMENKVRIHDTDELKIEDIGQDTNEVALEFNLVDSLNEDISKIFATFDVINEAVGSPVNKYREEYIELEDLRKIYFQRLEYSVNFTSFFNLFQWFDKKFVDAIRQLLPARVNFVGGEQVVESHFLERPKVGFKYDLFFDRTSLENGKIEIPLRFRVAQHRRNVIARLSENEHEGSFFIGNTLVINPDTLLPVSLGDSLPALNMASEDLISTYTRGIYDKQSEYRRHNNSSAQVNEDIVAYTLEGGMEKRTVSSFADGQERDIKLSQGLEHIYFYKYSGDEPYIINDPNTTINFKNSIARKNLDGIQRVNFANTKLGNLFCHKMLDSSKDNEFYFDGHPHYVSEEHTTDMSASWYESDQFITASMENKFDDRVFYALTTDGVEGLREIENADVDILFINAKVAKNVED